LARKRARRVSLDERAKSQSQQNDPKVEYISASRQEICKLEIDSAIRLFLIHNDPISAHLLASAATEIMTVLSGGNPEVGLNALRDLLERVKLPDDEQKEIFDHLLHPYNFAKHSSSDSSITNQFSIDYIATTIYVAIHSYKVLFVDLSPEMKVFYPTFQAWKSEFWKDTANYNHTIQLSKAFPLNGASFEEFCNFGRRMLTAAGIVAALTL
jgi:hypothetical protein